MRAILAACAWTGRAPKVVPAPVQWRCRVRGFAVRGRAPRTCPQMAGPGGIGGPSRPAVGDGELVGVAGRG